MIALFRSKFSLSFCMASIFFFSSLVMAQDRLVMSGPDNFYPLQFLNHQGLPAGSNLGFWRSAAKTENFKIVFLFDSMKNAQRDVLDGRADFVSPIIGEPNISGLELTKSYYHINIYLFYETGLGLINGFTDLAGLRIGAVESMPVDLYLSKQRPAGVTLVRYKNRKQMFAAATRGEIQAFCSPLALAKQQFDPDQLEASFHHTSVPVLIFPIYAAVQKGRTKLLQRLNNAIDSQNGKSGKRLETQDKIGGPDVFFPWDKAVLVSLGCFLAFFFVALWNWQLRRKVRQATERLVTSNKKLELEIGRRKNAQSELAHINRKLEGIVLDRTKDLRHKAEELEAANERLRAMDALKSMMVSSVSHELRTPLTSIRGFAKLVDKDFERHFLSLVETDKHLHPKATRIKANLAIIESEGARLSRLINDMLDLSKIEAGRMQWRDRPVTPEVSILSAVSAVRTQFEKNPQVNLDIRIAKDLPTIIIDPDRFEQMIINLLDNACKFTKEGSVSVEATVHGDTLQIAIADTGIGIPPEYQETIFETFRQVERETMEDKPAGTGLGLAICRGIVEHYNGSITVRSTPEKGTTFTLTIPSVQ